MSETGECEWDSECGERAGGVRIGLSGGCEIVGNLCPDHAEIQAALLELGESGDLW